MTPGATPIVARRLVVHGVVQGVGFRPYVWRLATREGVRGWVRNDGGVVTIHAEGEPESVGVFEGAIAREAPRLARIDEVLATHATIEGATDFAIDASSEAGGERLVPPDAATCPACLAELFDPTDRRALYPFVNCTDCGPRFTIIESLPYDRARTSMRVFPMCEDCRREYEDPADRRFHAEPVACPVCGPRLRLVDASGKELPGDPIEHAAMLLRAGATVALKGLGGFHLACNAIDEAAVHGLRQRKRRPGKPFAVMVSDLGEVRTWFDPTEDEERALTSWRAPVVLVRERRPLAAMVAPGHRRHGVMLPSTPLHHLLTRAAGEPLVMTSGNASDEPICIDEGEAFVRLRDIAGAFLTHDRQIVARYDDSVVLVRTGEREPSVLRRARSSAPAPLLLRHAAPVPILGTGAELHGSFCLLEDERAFLSQHVGDLDTEEAMQAYRDAYDRAREVFRIEPAVVAHDLHPDLLTTRFAQGLGLRRVEVQHHHAHVVATMAEHGLEGEVLGLAFDGLGFGPDGTIWGGELLRCTPSSFERVGRLRPVRQPGGDTATRHPWRMAMAHAADAGVLEEVVPALRVHEHEADVVAAQLRSGLASPLTSSAGRLFDAVAALVGVCREATYEGQAPTLLEQAAGASLTTVSVGLDEVDGLLEIDTRDLIAAVVAARAAGEEVPAIAASFHASFAAVTAEAAARLAHGLGLGRVVLGGGVFSNDLFTRDLVTRLTAAGLEVFLPREVPVGDGGIALGQVVVASAREGD